MGQSRGITDTLNEHLDVNRITILGDRIDYPVIQQRLFILII
jgi:hypothetical protein